MTALQSESEDNLRLKRAAEFLTHCRNAETEARRALNEAVQQTARAKEKHETLFHECEQRAVARRKSGAIENTAGY
jgi:uncharacterized membrane protein YqiK